MPEYVFVEQNSSNTVTHVTADSDQEAYEKFLNDDFDYLDVTMEDSELCGVSVEGRAVPIESLKTLTT